MTTMPRKTVYITGASRGIGHTVAKEFLRDGWNVAACGRDHKQLLSIADGIDSGSLLPLVFDVRDQAGVENSVSECIEKFSGIDVLVNNAGILIEGTLELTPNKFSEIFDVNVKAAWMVLQAIVPQMKKQGSGSIFNVASVGGLKGFAGVGAYCSTKFALRGISESLFNELNDLGIKVTSINPSWVESDMSYRAPMSKDKKIQPIDIYKAIAFVLSLGPSACVPELTIQCTSDIL